jgi:hypothetical protein
MLDQYFKLGCDCLMLVLCYQFIFRCHSIIQGYEIWVAKASLCEPNAKKCEYG